MFTLEQIEEIHRKLQLFGVKDKDLPILTEQLNGNEIITVVKDGRNIQLLISQLLDFNSFTAEQLESLRGPRGIDGKDAYQTWLSKGNVGTYDDYIAVLQLPALLAAETSTIRVNNKLNEVGVVVEELNSLSNQTQDGLLEMNIAKDLAYEIVTHPPVIIDKYWHSWNHETNQYDTTYIKAEGDSAYLLWLDAGNVGTLEDYLEDIKGDPFTYDDFTPEQIAELQRPAADAITSIQEVELAVETAEGLRQLAENKRQTDTSIAIFNAEKATEDANDAAILANEKAGLANDAASLANEVANNPNKVVADYWHKWNTTTKAYENTGIKAKGESGAVALVKQVTGTSETDVMSQKAVSEEIANLAGEVEQGNSRLFDIEKWGRSLITDKTSGYWGVTITAAHTSATLSKANIINIDFTDCVLTGITAQQLIDSGNNLKFYNESGSYISQIAGSEIVAYHAIEGGFRITPPLNAKYMALMFLNEASATISLKTGKYVGHSDEYKFKVELIPAGTFTANSEILYKSPNLLTSFTAGYFNSIATSKLTITSSSTIYRSNFILANVGKKYVLQGVGSTTRAFNVFLTYFDVSGNVIGRAEGNTLTAIENGWTFTIPEDDRIIDFAIIVDINDRASVSLKLGKTVSEVEFGVIKKELLPDSQNIAMPNISDIKAALMFNRGNSPLPSMTKKKLLILIGQSNMDGRADASEQPQWFIDANRTLNYVNYTKILSGAFSPFALTNSSQFSCEVELFKKIYEKINQDFYVVRLAVGGSAISILSPSSGFWTPYFEIIPNDKRKLALELKQMTLNAIQNAGSDFEISAVLMHQGENDLYDVENYYQNLKNVISFIRGIVNNQTLPFFLGGISEKSTAWRYGIEKAKLDIANEDGYVSYAPVQNNLALLKSDILHFNAAGNLDLANSFYTKLVEKGVI